MAEQHNSGSDSLEHGEEQVDKVDQSSVDKEGQHNSQQSDNVEDFSSLDGNTQASTSARTPAPLAQPQPEQNQMGAFGSIDDSNVSSFDLIPSLFNPGAFHVMMDFGT